MYLLICSCGHKMKVPKDYIGRVCTCVKCKQKIRITEKNTRPLAGGKDGGAEAAPRKKRIGELLVEANLISLNQLKEALHIQKESGGKTGEILLSLGYINVKSFAGFLSKQPGIASIDLSNYEISIDLLELIPREFAVEHDVFPIDKLGSLLTVAMGCPLDSRTIKELEDHTKLRVKALLCPLDDIQTVIARYYPEGKQAAAPPSSVEESAKHLEGALRLENAAALIRRIGSLPALPDTVQRAQEVMVNPDVSIHEVVEVFETDPTVAAKILSVANSAAYGFPNRVDSVSLAATLLGLKETFSLLMSMAVVDTLGPDYREFWSDATACAGVATTVARACGQEQRTGVYAAALLHDIGRIALWQVIPKRYEMVDNSLVGADLVAAEQETLGLSHTEAGFELATNWGLPEDLTEPIRFHHSFGFAENAKEITAIVAVAAALIDCGQGGVPDEAAVLENCGEALAFLELDFDMVAPLSVGSPSEDSPASTS